MRFWWCPSTQEIIDTAPRKTYQYLGAFQRISKCNEGHYFDWNLFCCPACGEINEIGKNTLIARPILRERLGGDGADIVGWKEKECKSTTS